ncbi:hypothetical protein CA830_29460, partial [Burkholderia multivorans]
MRVPVASPSPRAEPLSRPARAARRRSPRAALAAMMASGLLTFGSAGAADTAALVMADDAHDVILEVSVNGESTALLAHFRERDGHLSASGADLRTIGFATDRLGIAD